MVNDPEAQGEWPDREHVHESEGMMRIPILGRRKQYWQKIRAMFGSSLIGYWPLSETSGATAFDMTTNAINGAYNAVTLGQPGIGDNKTCPLWDANGDAVNLYSANYASLFNTQTGAFGTWIYADPASWTDTVIRHYAVFGTDSNNQIELRKGATGTFEAYYRGGGTIKGITPVAFKTLDGWINVILSWNKAGDGLTMFINGIKAIQPVGGLGSWSGAIANNFNYLGRSSASTNTMRGKLAHSFLLNTTIQQNQAWNVASQFLSGVLVFDGDSRTAGKSYPGTVYSTIGKRLGLANYAVTGQGVAAMITNGATNIDPLVKGGKSNVLIAWAGVNEAASGANTIYTNLVTYCQARRAAGFKVVVCTEIDAQDATRNAAGWHSTVYPALNTLIRDNYATFSDGLADLGGDARLQDATNATYYNADKVHLVEAGHDVVASIVSPVASGLL